jgi:sarcosine oxidase
MGCGLGPVGIDSPAGFCFLEAAMAKQFDVIIAGLGAMGSAAAYHLSRRGCHVLGLDRFHPPHSFGSSHGLTRIIREAYFEHPAYVPLIQRAYELWADLERESGRKLLLQTGGLMIGRRDGVIVGGAERSAREHRLAHRLLSAEELRREFPAFAPTNGMVGVWEPRAGILFPELAIQTHLELAAARGATLRYDEPVLKWESKGDHVCVSTEQQVYRAGRLLLTAGAWLNSLLPGHRLPLHIERQILFWFDESSNAEWFTRERCPISLWEYESRQYFYTFPNLGDGVKIALHHQGEITTPDGVRREVSAVEIEHMRGLLGRFLPAANGALKSTTVCIYTNTPDEHFLLDSHPEDSLVYIASPCSGHGFKFSSVIGEIAAARLEDRPLPFDLSLFCRARLATAPSP